MSIERGAGSGQWCLDLVNHERNFLAERLRAATSYNAGFQDPAAVGRAVGAQIAYLADIPGPADFLTDGRVVWVRWDADQRVRGTRAFCGVATAVLGLQRSTGCNNASVSALAGRLAAPPPLVMRLGLSESIRRQQWVTEAFLLAFWASITGAM
ncbi:hypothetical protein WMF38_56865 [Sorangium sp. So ce118]